MASAKFYIEKRRNSKGKIKIERVPIYLYFSYNGKRFQYYTGERIDSKFWDQKKCRVKSSYPGSFELNALLDQLSEKAYRFYRERRIAGSIPGLEEFRNEFSSAPKTDQVKTVFNYYQEYLESIRSSIGHNTIKKYTTTYNHLLQFVSSRKMELTFNSFDDHFINSFINFSIGELKHNNNTIAKSIKIIKTFLHWATKRGYNSKLDFHHFTFKGFEGEIIYLSMDELMTLYKTKLDKDHLNKARDIFCFGCFTGLRYSDIKNLKRVDVRGDFIRSISIKTRDQICVPLNQFSKSLLEKYANYPSSLCFPVMSNQKMNEYLKEIGKEAGLNEIINHVSFQGTKRIENKYYKYQLLTTHVARKTFVSNAHQKGIPIETIMKITNHKNHKTVARYMKIEEQQVFDAMQKIF